MTLKHSPGPWVFDRYGWYIFDSEDNVIAEVNSAHPGDGQIFAAAPDMLRLLRVLERIYSGREDRSDSALRWREAMEESGDLIRRLDGDT